MSRQAKSASRQNSRMAAQLQGEIKKGRASLIGGIAVGIAVLALSIAISRDLGIASTATLVAGLAAAVVVAVWIRIADL